MCDFYPNFQSVPSLLPPFARGQLPGPDEAARLTQLLSKLMAQNGRVTQMNASLKGAQQQQQPTDAGRLTPTYYVDN
ncbi:hypothetical protein niasHT_000078 [Heterodera trifolii]|uniref:Uncharacterized protein n=1 Tax=Heterodera trifolii TaxID=157864 RepID=A0ABD2LVL9_9BILA